jgi:hypothetical protein
MTEHESLTNCSRPVSDITSNNRDDVMKGRATGDKPMGKKKMAGVG